MILFIAALLLLTFLAQRYSARNAPAWVREDFYPERNVAEPDEVFCLHVTLQNTSRHYLPYVRFSLHLPGEIQPQDTAHCTKSWYDESCTISYTTWLKPHQQTDFQIPVRIAQRGRYIFHPLCIYIGDFLGLHEQERKSTHFREVVVAPRENGVSQIETAMGGFLGDHSVRRFLYEDPVLTAGFREYTGQEPMKKISWTQSAKGRGLMVRNDDYTTEPLIHVILNGDTAESMSQNQEVLEQCFSLTRTVCRMLEDRRIPYDLQTNVLSAGGWFDGSGRCILRGFGSVHFRRVLELLGRATDMVSISGDALLQQMTEKISSGSIILITVGPDLPGAYQLRRLREAADGCLLVLSPGALGQRDSA